MKLYVIKRDTGAVVDVIVDTIENRVKYQETKYKFIKVSTINKNGENKMTFQPSRPSVIARHNKAVKRQIIKDILIAIFAIACAFVGIWVAYFATF